MLQIALANAVIASLLAVLVVVISRFCKKPALLHTLWIIVLAKLVIWPIVDLRIPRRVHEGLHQVARGWSIAPSPAPESSRSVSANLEQVEPRSDREPSAVLKSSPTKRSPNLKTEIEGDRNIVFAFAHFSWMSLLSVFWLFGSLVLGGVATFRILRFKTTTRLARPIDHRLEHIAEQVANQYQMSVPRIRLVRATMSPVVWCFLSRPTVYVPQGLLDELEDREIATLMAHEFAHIKRRDYLVRWLELVTTVLYWWLPIVWFAQVRLRAAEEQLCDAMVVQHFPTKTSSYVSTLLQTVEFLIDSRSTAPVLASGMGNFQILKRRCEMIMGRTFEKLSASNRVLLWTLAVATLPFAISLPTSGVAEAQTSTSSLNALDAVPRRSKAARKRFAAGVRQDLASTTSGALDQETSERHLGRDTNLTLGDLRIRLDDLLELKGFESKSRTSDFGALNQVTGTDEPKSSNDYWEYTDKTNAFSKISYQESPQWASYYRFEVQGKYDKTAARAQLERQLSRTFGSKKGTRKIQHEGRVMTLSYRVQKTHNHTPHVIIELHEIPDWAPESETERRKREQSESDAAAATDDLFG